MARPPLILDASVGVKWFSRKDEASLNQALSIREAHLSQKILVVVPDLFYYEVTNALTNKKFFSSEIVQSASSALFSLNLHTINININLLSRSISLARKFNITVYDSCYIAAAASLSCPLVTANPRHQKQDMGCRVITLDEWKTESF